MRRGGGRRRDDNRRQEGPRVNYQIRTRRVLVIDETGRRMGEFLVDDAITMAKRNDLDLVEVSPNASPPVCKMMDYGKFKYDQKKKARESKDKQAKVVVKEIKLRPKTDKHDFDVKTGHARRFLEAGHKVKITMRFRGREHAHRNIGRDVCLQVADSLKDIAQVESHPAMDGRQMTMILSPH